ncbi:MAG: tRNA (N6-threonylcarbamoyladenosine(37)-N6)-methyltransferase TrmO [Chloroflexota bacterium]
MDTPYSLRPIGIVHSSVADAKDMPGEGVAASVEVYEAYAEALRGIEDNSHVAVVAWLHGADRSALTGAPRGLAEPRGVFGTRSPNRPNPLGLSHARVLGVEGRTLRLAALDFVDGTPVVDLKGPNRGWDYAWSAVGFRDLRMVSETEPSRALDLLMHEAENFHGERCPGLALGVRMVYATMQAFAVSARDKELLATVGVDGCVADAVQALTGATLGNHRLKPSSATAFHFQLGERELTFWTHDLAGRSVEEIMAAEADRLFSVSEGPASHEKEPPSHAASLAGERRARVLAVVQASLINGKLPCPIAFQLARETGMGLRQIGQLANEEGFRIAQCQLGCFR